MNQPEDHMDELFRKAGELYPLKTDGADWDKVLAGLEQEPAGGVVPPITRRSGARRLWWLALLIPMVWLCSKYTGVSFMRSSERSGTGVATVKAPTVKAPAGKTTTGGTAAAIAGGAHSNNTTLSNHSLFDNPKTSNPVPVKMRTAPLATPAQGVSTAMVIAPDAGTSDNRIDAGTSDIRTSLYTQQAVADLPLKAPSASPLQHQGSVALKTPPKRKPLTLYAGVLAGPDLSTVKWQELQNPGYSLGFVVGLRFNKRLAIEASALWDHKVYYTSAEYAETKKMNLPGTVRVDDINGNCNMLEIPISLRYDFWKLKKGTIYATAGFSSYIMMKENYNYSADNGSYSWDANRSYTNTGTNWFSNIHLSAGYTWNWAHVGDLRIEPYLKVPLSGVGFLNLPMTSAGLYIGLTRSFR
jgi:hypothetical protein